MLSDRVAAPAVVSHSDGALHFSAMLRSQLCGSVESLPISNARACGQAHLHSFGGH